MHVSIISFIKLRNVFYFVIFLHVAFFRILHSWWVNIHQSDVRYSLGWLPVLFLHGRDWRRVLSSGASHAIFLTLISRTSQKVTRPPPKNFSGAKFIFTTARKNIRVSTVLRDYKTLVFREMVANTRWFIFQKRCRSNRHSMEKTSRNNCTATPKYSTPETWK